MTEKAIGIGIKPLMIFYLSLLLAFNSLAAELYDFEAIKRALLIKPYVGTYLNYETDELGSMFIEDNKLHFLYNSKGLTYYIFIIPINFENIITNYSTEDLENGTDEIRYVIQNSVLSKIRITENANRQVVENLTINFSKLGELEISHSRRYFVRSNNHFSPWMLDENDVVALSDSFQKTFTFKKTTSTPFTQDQINELRNQIINLNTQKTCVEYLN